MQVGGDVEAFFRALVHAADAAGCKHPDPREVRGDHGCCNGGRPGATPGEASREIGARQLGDALRLSEAGKLVGFQTDVQRAVQHGDGGRNRACGADVLLDLRRHLDVLGVGHAVGDDCALQRHDGRSIGTGGGNFGGIGDVDLGHSGVSPET